MGERLRGFGHPRGTEMRIEQQYVGRELAWAVERIAHRRCLADDDVADRAQAPAERAAKLCVVLRDEDSHG